MGKKLNIAPVKITASQHNKGPKKGSEKKATGRKRPRHTDSGDSAHSSASRAKKNRRKSPEASIKLETTDDAFGTKKAAKRPPDEEVPGTSSSDIKAKKGRRQVKERSATRSSRTRSHSKGKPKVKKLRKSSATEWIGRKNNRGRKSSTAFNGDKPKRTVRGRAKSSTRLAKSRSASARSRSRSRVTKGWAEKVRASSSKKAVPEKKIVPKAAFSKVKRSNGQGTSQPAVCLKLNISVIIEGKGQPAKQKPAVEYDAKGVAKEVEQQPKEAAKEMKNAIAFECCYTQIDKPADGLTISVDHAVTEGNTGEKDLMDDTTEKDFNSDDNGTNNDFKNDAAENKDLNNYSEDDNDDAGAGDDRDGNEGPGDSPASE